MTIGPYKIIRTDYAWHVRHDGCEHWIQSLDYLKRFLLDDKRLTPAERIKAESIENIKYPAKKA